MLDVQRVIVFETKLKLQSIVWLLLWQQQGLISSVQSSASIDWRTVEHCDNWINIFTTFV